MKEIILNFYPVGKYNQTSPLLSDLSGQRPMSGVTPLKEEEAGPHVAGARSLSQHRPSLFSILLLWNWKMVSTFPPLSPLKHPS